ncbi:MAG: LuxR C-terminal-related transcriptional regulator [Oligoflexia bacterium]|nr:LuxR C-terminal-related transcriptional regulator [Oligoflexia bacterium]
MAFVVDELNDIVPDRKRVDPIFQNLKGGMVVWDADHNCHFASDSLSLLLGGHEAPTSITTPSSLIGTPTLISGRYQRYINTTQGPRYIDTTVQPVVNRDQKIIGYVAICQDITELQEPLQYQTKFIELLKGVAKGITPYQASEMIYKCVQHFGFREMRIILFKNGILQTMCQIMDGHAETISSQWEHSLRSDPHNPLLLQLQEFHRTGLIYPKVFQPNTASYSSEVSYTDLICLPIVDQNELLGFLTLATPTFLISNETLRPHGKLSIFADELAPVMRRIFFYTGHDADEYHRLRTRLENYNLNQKQIRILEMLIRGESNKGIAEAIHLSEQGVKYHVGNLLEKFESKNRVELRGKLNQILKATN